MSTPVSWWMVHASAQLQTVAAHNVTCFGRGGVPRYPVDTSTASPPDPALICVEMTARAADSDSPVKLASVDANLAQVRSDAKQAIWSGYDTAQHMQISWVWDFYRLLSHTVLRVAIPDQDAQPDAAWQDAIDGIRALEAGDVIRLAVRSACGDIHQAHPLTASARRWEPAQTTTDISQP